ncbi:MAG: AsnC family transcriptional regulator, partial [Candidatus Micrarchaeota archaeon]|nr:AsnC family transcriptional regulator [Candidatus Micrarchaeota archaeon]
MKQFPPKVLEVFENLKKKYPPRLDLKLIKGRYYVYKERGMWLKEKGKNKTISEYLGKITEDGLFVKKKLSANGDFENAKAIIAEHGGKIIWEEKKEQDIMAEEQHLTATAIDLKILTALSMNARIPIPKLAKMVGLNEQTAYSRIKSLEEKLGIKYILEIDIEKLGYIQYLVLIKFEEASLTAEELKKVIGDNPRIQFAAITK